MAGERALLLVGMLLSWGCPGDKVGTGDSGKSDDSGDSSDSDSAVDADDSAHADDSSATDDTDDSAPPPVDNDGDGYDSTVDCDDDDASVHPGADDTWYDGVDMDCSGSDYDADGDGHDSPDYGGDDCDDNSADPPTNTSEVITLGAVPACDKTARISGMLVGAAEGVAASLVKWNGDINGDGFGDILVGSLYADEGGFVDNGAGYIVFGPVDGEKSLADADAMLFGAEVASGADLMSGLGDTNADGYDDIAIPNQDAAGSWTVYIFEGPLAGDTAVETGDASITLEGIVYPAGDLNGDGNADLFSPHESSVFIGPFVGSASADDAYLSIETSGSGCSGGSLYAVGDVNADGLDDIVFGCGGKGAFFFYGGRSGELAWTDADATVGGDLYNARSAGDNNGDGYADVLLGQIGVSSAYDHSGNVYLMTGPIRDGTDTTDAEATWSGETHDDYLAATPASGGDLNADGFDDIVLVSHVADFGFAHIMLAPNTGSGTQGDADWSPTTEGTGSDLDIPGRLGDTDGDGYQDIVLDTPKLDVYHEVDGAVWILTGGSI